MACERGRKESRCLTEEEKRGRGDIIKSASSISKRPSFSFIFHLVLFEGLFYPSRSPTQAWTRVGVGVTNKVMYRVVKIRNTSESTTLAIIRLSVILLTEGHTPPTHLRVFQSELRSSVNLSGFLVNVRGFQPGCFRPN